jgi:hypothetical protein
MDQEAQRELARLTVMESMFDHDGWKEVVAELQNEIEVIKAQILRAEAWDEVTRLQGKAEQCSNMIYLADSVYNMRKQLQMNEEYEDADV